MKSVITNLRLGVDPIENLFSSITCYNDLRNQGELIIDMVEIVLDTMHEYLSKPECPRLRMVIEGERIRPRIKAFNEKNWASAKEHIRNGEANFLNVFSDNDDMCGAFCMIVDYCLGSIRGLPNIDYAIKKEYVGDHFPRDLQQANVAIVKEFSQKLKSAGSYVTVDTMWPHTLVLSPHERYMDLHISDAYINIHRYFRGYFWGNFLNPSHVEILGGLDRIEHEAPVYLTERLDDGGIYLQTTEDINTLTLEILRPLKRFLQPVLAPRRYSASDPIHYAHLKVITDEE